jgi:archaeosine-15-forming tRNA-guanine transglycosylase
MIRSEKILSGKRKRALAAIGNNKRVMPDGLIFITKQEAETLGKWIEELEERVAIMMECQEGNNDG